MEKLECGHVRTASVVEVLVEDIDRLEWEVKEHEGVAADEETANRFRY